MNSQEGIDTASLHSRFFIDDGCWKNAPLLRGTTCFKPIPDMKSIMVTGGAGFIASWVVRHLVTTYAGYKVVCFDKLDYCSSLNNIRMLQTHDNFSFVHGDVTNAADVMRCLQQYNVDTILHFAAQSHVDLSFGNSYCFTINNVYGTHVLLESAAKASIRRFIHVSTDEVYGEVKENDADLLENSLLVPTNPYAATKAAAEMLLLAYSKSFGLSSIIVRSNNVYGPHQYPEKIIPKFINLLERGRRLIIHGDGKHTRRYLYAADAVDAFDTILHKGIYGTVYNVGSADEISNLQLCDRLLDLYQKSPEEKPGLVEYTADRPFNDRRYAVNGTRLRQLGWTQKTNLETGLRLTVDWYRAHATWWGNIDGVLTAFPTGTHPDTTVGQKNEVSKDALGGAQRGMKRKLEDD